jgi:hypothetical protein
MFRHITAAALVSSFLLGTSLPALSQQACAPEKVTAAIDTYAQHPFGARAWRMLNGLGDPGIDEESAYFYGDWQERAEWKELVTALAPEAKDLAEPGYSCRLSYPLATLRQHLVTLPVKDPYIKQWLKAQSVVFQWCSNSSATRDISLPAALEVKPELAELQKYDRAYQEAATAFYSGPANAIALFKTIAASASPHRAAARYNIANLLANAHNVVEARKETDAILADPTLASVHDITRQLRGYIANVEDTPPGWQQQIDETIATLNQPLSAINQSEGAKRRYANALFDIAYGGIKAKADDWWVVGKLPENPTLSKAIVDSARNQPMALWMMTGQTITQKLKHAPWSMVGPKWQTWNASLVDRAMSLQPAANGINPLARSLINGLTTANSDLTRAAAWSSAKAAADKARATCGAAPETAAVGELTLQAARLSAEAGRYDEVYSSLGTLPLQKSETLNAIILPKLMQHILATGNVEEGRRFRDKFLSEIKMTSANVTPNDAPTDAASFMAWVAEDKAHWQTAATLSADRLSSTLYNFLPSSELQSLAADPRYDARQKATLSRVAWTRNYARTGKATDKSLADMLASNPEIAAAYDKAKKDYPSASPEHALTLTILRSPRFNILVSSPDLFWGGDTPEKFDDLSFYDHNDTNWWCPLESDRMIGAVRASYDGFTGMTELKTFHAEELKPLLEADAVAKADAARDQLLKNHPMVKAVNWKELAGLAKAPSAPKALTQAALRWAKTSDGKDGAPEALALAVRATRFGCNWHGSHKSYSKPAQEMLKVKFPTTEWSSKTPYWFDCQYKQYDKDGKELATCAPKQWPKQKPLK